MPDDPNEKHLISPLSRRGLITGGATAVAGLAGCFSVGEGENGSPTSRSKTDTFSKLTPIPGASTFWVSPDGNDESGNGSEDNPWATIRAARDHLRETDLSQFDGDVEVRIAPGTYRISEPITFTDADSGTESTTIHYRASGPIGSASLSGGKPLTDWQPTDSIGDFSVPGDLDVYQTAVDSPFQTLYENGTRARKARYPNRSEDTWDLPLSKAPYLRAQDILGTKSGNRLRYDTSEIDAATATAVANAPRPEMFIWSGGENDWFADIVQIDRVNQNLNQFISTSSFVFYSDGNFKEDFGHSRYYLQNVPQFLTEPGEFYLNEEAGMVYYAPLDGDPNENEILAPQTGTVVEVQGETSDTPVSNLRFSGLEVMTSDFDGAYSDGSYSSERTEHEPMIDCVNTESVTFEHCHLANSGFSAISFSGWSKNNRVAGCHIEHTGNNGVVLASSKGITGVDLGEGDITQSGNTIVEDCYIHHIGELVGQSNGVAIGQQQATVRNCTIHDASKSATDWRGQAHENTLEYLDVWRTNQDTGDMGAFYVHLQGDNTDGKSTLRQTRIDRTKAHPSSDDIGPNGIFVDGQNTNQTFEHIDITRSEGPPWRGNGNKPSDHDNTNVSWLEDFDPGKVDYTSIGVTEDFMYQPALESHQPAPASVSATLEDGQVHLEWTRAPGASSYDVYRTTEDDPGVVAADWPERAPSPDGGAYSLVEEGITDRSLEIDRGETDYTYVVVAVGPDGTESDRTAHDSIASIPQEVTTTREGDSVTINWSEEDPAAEYGVYRTNRLNGPYQRMGDWTQVETVTDTAVTVSAPSSGAHQYTVTTITEGGAESNFSDIQSVHSDLHIGQSTVGRVDVENGELQLTADGANRFGAVGQEPASEEEEFYSVFEPDVTGDFVAECRVNWRLPTDRWSQIGFAAKNDLTTAAVEADGFASCTTRPQISWTKLGDFLLQGDADGDGALETAAEPAFDGTSTNWLRFEREGTTFRGAFKTASGDDWTQLGEIEVPSAEETQDVGLIIAAGGQGDPDLPWRSITSATVESWSIDPRLDPTASLTESGAVSLQWTPAPNASGYRIERAPAEGGSFSEVGQVGGDTHSFTDDSTATNTGYRYRIGIRRSGRMIGRSSVVQIHTNPPPTDIEATRLDSGGVELSWSGSATAEEYVVYRSITDGDYSAIESGITQTTYQDSSAGKDSLYYRIAAVNAAGEESAKSDSGFVASTREISTFANAESASFDGLDQGPPYSISVASKMGNDYNEEQADEYATIYRPDGIGTQGEVIVKVQSLEDTGRLAKAGIMLKNDMTKPGESLGYVGSFVKPHRDWESQGDYHLFGDDDDNGFPSWGGTYAGGSKFPSWLRLVRDGDTFTGYYKQSADAEWIEIGSKTRSNADDTLDVGIFVDSADRSKTTTAVFGSFEIK